jgi:hypothetical protein
MKIVLWWREKIWVKKGGAASPTNCSRANVIRAILIYPSRFMPSAWLPVLPLGGFFLFPVKKLGLLTADTREFPMVLGCRLV